MPHDISPIQEDGFKKDRELLNMQIEENSLKYNKLSDETDWLILRAKIVDAEKSACDARKSELKIAQEMARYGSLNANLSEQNEFIDQEQKVLWNARLEQRRNLRMKAEARARLLHRDLSDLRLKLVEKGYKVPANSVFE